ncbi:MAG: hypothetical protein AAF726_16095 [Planctomycetota bacterium]
MHKRKRKLVNKPLQIKLIATFTVIGATCALFQVVLVNFGLLEVAKSISAGGSELLEETRWMMLRVTAWTLGALVPLMACIGIAATHRIAGPAYRMTMHLQDIADGGPVRPCKIRKDDEMHELCEALNAALERLAPAGNMTEDYVEPWQLEATPSPIRPADSASDAPSETKGESKAEAKAADEAA